MKTLQQADAEELNQITRYWTSSHSFSARVRLKLAQSHQDQYDWLDSEFANLRGSYTWLATQNGTKEAHLLLDYLQMIAPYLQQRGLHGELLGWCEAGLHASEILQQAAGWVLFIRGKAENALGQWEEASKSFQATIEVSEQEDPQTHFQALLALGRLQFNQGEYEIAFETMSAAEAYFAQTADDGQLMTVHGERAAYHLNRGDLDKAKELYLEMDRHRQYAGIPEPSDHLLLMLGVIYRKKKDYKRAVEYLQKLCDRGEMQLSSSTTATATHHLAWAYLSKGDLQQARSLCGRAIMLYEEIGDERGLSDAYEQLGCIVLADGKGREAVAYLQRSLLMRRQLHNQQGEASSLRHLAIANFTMGRVLNAFSHLTQSLLIYRRLGVLSRQRMLGMLREFLSWAAGWRKWSK